MGRKLWIDTDAGVDDALAILMALACQDIEIVGISTVRGNTAAHQVSLNVLRLLKVAGHQEVPVYQGCQQALLGNKGDASFYHGEDGFGDVPDPNPPSQDLLQKEHAVNALINTVRDSEDDITLVCLGPLSNIAMAIRLDPNFGKNLKTCYIMGGAYEGKGNITMSAEFNFYSDPEAANIVLSDLHAPITMACWELCLKHSLPWKWYREEFTSMPTIKGRFIHALEQKAMSIYYENMVNHDGVEYETADQLMMAIVTEPKIVQKTKTVYCTVELQGSETRGQLVCDWINYTKKTPNVTLVTEIDVETYKDLLLGALQ